jgi:hypothetical protein
MSMATLALTCGSVTVGAFGMNLISGMEHNITAFPLVVTSTALSMTAIYAMCRWYYRRNVEPSHTNDQQSLARLLPYLDDIEHLVHMRQKLGETKFDRATFQAMVLEATGKVVDSKDVDLVFQALDSDDDSLLAHGELLALLQRKRRGEAL